MEYEELAVELVYNHLSKADASIDTFKLVWFCKTLQNWKAMVADISNGGHFYEVTYNGDKKETYIDEYVKATNLVVPDVNS